MDSGERGGAETTGGVDLGRAATHGREAAPGGEALGPFASKAEARRAVWDELERLRLHRFPFPAAGRIPNFAGVEAAARRLCALPEFERTACIKVNPDAPQRYIRKAALAAGKCVIVPAPRLKGGFILLDPRRIPAAEVPRAVSLSRMDRYGRELTLPELARLAEGIGLVVVGSVAVDTTGRRAGKGEGYADREYALLRELGMAEAPVATTVHDVQVTLGLPAAPHDIAVDIIATPRRLIRTERERPQPQKIDWSAVGPRELEEMPVLADLRLFLGGG